MSITISGQNIPLSEALKTKVAQKLEKLHHRFETESMHVVLKTEKERHTMDATTRITGKTLKTQATTDDMYKTLDALVDKLHQQLTVEKNKRLDHS